MPISRYIYARVYNPGTQERCLQAFATMEDLRAAREEGYRIRRITRKEVEDEMGSRKIQVYGLDSDCCGYVVGLEGN